MGRARKDEMREANHSHNQHLMMGGRAGAGSGGGASAGAGDAAPVADLDLPVRRLVHRMQDRAMSCSLSTVKSAGEAFGRKMGTEDKIRGRTETRKKGTYGVGTGNAGIPFSTVAHTEEMGAYGRELTKADLKRIETAGHIPAMITSAGRGKHVMPVRSGSPRKPEHIELFDPMIKKPTFKRYEEVFNGDPFKSGYMTHTSHGLYGIAPERSSARPRSSSMESLSSTDEGLTRTTGERKVKSNSGHRKK